MRLPNSGSQQLIALGVIVFVTVIVSRALFPRIIIPQNCPTSPLLLNDALIPQQHKNDGTNITTIKTLLLEKHVVDEDSCDNLWDYGVELTVNGTPHWKPFQCEMVDYRNLTYAPNYSSLLIKITSLLLFSVI
jgi:hypothetical protein